MWKKFLLAFIAVYVAYFVLDYILHGLILKGTYQEYKDLWRPDMMSKMWIMFLTYAVSAFCFVYIYFKLISPKSTKNAIIYGLIIGIFSGTGMGYGSYCMFPIPYFLAAAWFWGCIVEMTIIGWILSLIIKE